MNISHFSYTPKATLVLATQELEILRDCSKRHYDKSCKSLSMPGGLIYGWLNHSFDENESDVVVTVTTDECDQLEKVLEVSNDSIGYELFAFFKNLLRSMIADTEAQKKIYKPFSKPHFSDSVNLSILETTK